MSPRFQAAACDSMTARTAATSLPSLAEDGARLRWYPKTTAATASSEAKVKRCFLLMCFRLPYFGGRCARIRANAPRLQARREFYGRPSRDFGAGETVAARRPRKSLDSANRWGYSHAPPQGTHLKAGGLFFRRAAHALDPENLPRARPEGVQHEK